LERGRPWRVGKELKKGRDADVYKNPNRFSNQRASNTTSPLYRKGGGKLQRTVFF